MIDAHAFPVLWSVDWILNALDTYREAGVDRVIIMDGDAGLQASRLRSNEIIPSTDEGYPNRTSTVKYLDEALRRGFKWMGEYALRHWGQGWRIPADDPVALQIYDLCGKYGVPITIHQDSAEYPGAYVELERALKHSPNCVFVFHGWWFGKGHLTMTDLETLTLRHPNLYVELAGQLEAEGDNWTSEKFLGGTTQDLFAYPNGTIREEWREIFEKYPDRFINGFDLWTQPAYELESIKMRVDYWRNLLGQLNQEAAQDIAYKNVEDILAHRVNLATRTATVATTSASHATTAVAQTARMSTAPQTTTISETEIRTAASTQPPSGAFTVEVIAIIVVALVIVATGVFYLRRRGK